MTRTSLSGERPWRRVRRVVAGYAPAAGADWSVTVPAGSVWEVHAVTAFITTSVAIGNRIARLVVSNGTSTVLDVPPAAIVVASSTARYTWYAAGQTYALAGYQVVTVPRLILPAGWVLRSATDALDTADAWSAPVLWVTETLVQAGAISLDELPDLRVDVVTLPTS